MQVNRSHYGRSGTLTCGESTLVGTVESGHDSTWDSYFQFRVKGADAVRLAFTQWDFTPEPSPLPEEPGLYAKLNEAGEVEVVFKVERTASLYIEWSAPGGRGFQASRRIDFESRLTGPGEITKLDKVNG